MDRSHEISASSGYFVGSSWRTAPGLDQPYERTRGTAKEYPLGV